MEGLQKGSGLPGSPLLEGAPQNPRTPLWRGWELRLGWHEPFEHCLCLYHAPILSLRVRHIPQGDNTSQVLATLFSKCLQWEEVTSLHHDINYLVRVTPIPLLYLGNSKLLLLIIKASPARELLSLSDIREREHTRGMSFISPRSTRERQHLSVRNRPRY